MNLFGRSVTVLSTSKKCSYEHEKYRDSVVTFKRINERHNSPKRKNSNEMNLNFCELNNWGRVALKEKATGMGFHHRICFDFDTRLNSKMHLHIEV